MRKGFVEILVSILLVAIVFLFFLFTIFKNEENDFIQMLENKPKPITVNFYDSNGMPIGSHQLLSINMNKLAIIGGQQIAYITVDANVLNTGGFTISSKPVSASPNELSASFALRWFGSVSKPITTGTSYSFQSTKGFSCGGEAACTDYEDCVGSPASCKIKADLFFTSPQTYLNKSYGALPSGTPCISQTFICPSIYNGDPVDKCYRSYIIGGGTPGNTSYNPGSGLGHLFSSSGFQICDIIIGTKGSCRTTTFSITINSTFICPSSYQGPCKTEDGQIIQPGNSGTITKVGSTNVEICP